jgi:hypothetical protein
MSANLCLLEQFFCFYGSRFGWGILTVLLPPETHPALPNTLPPVVCEARLIGCLAKMSGLESGPIGEGSIISWSPDDKPWIGAMQFDCGYLSPYFVTDFERMEVAFENVYILIHENQIGSNQDLHPLLEQIGKIGRPLLIIADDVGDEALATLVVAKLRGPLRVAAVRAPGSGDQRKCMLREIALLTGGKVITEDPNIQRRDILLSDLGQAKKIIVGKNHTLLEGRAKYDQLGLAEAHLHSNANILPVESLRTDVGPAHSQNTSKHGPHQNETMGIA